MLAENIQYTAIIILIVFLLIELGRPTGKTPPVNKWIGDCSFLGDNSHSYMEGVVLTIINKGKQSW